MDSIRLIQAPEYTEDEQQALIDFVLALKKTHVQEFLRQVKLPVSGTKSSLRDRIQEALDNGDLKYEQMVAFLDSVAIWGKQHVILYKGPRGDIQSWKDKEQVLQRLKSHRLGKLFGASLPLILPDKLTLSSITHTDGILRITAVQKQEYKERAPEHDDRKETEDGALITLTAHVYHLTRTIVAFEWDLHSNTAMLQITQLTRKNNYEEVAEEFFGLIREWLDIGQFGVVDIRHAIKRLHELEKDKKPEARSHKIDYRTMHGGRLSAKSSSPRDSVLADKDLDNAMKGIVKEGVGHLGNFYWLSPHKGQPSTNHNPLKSDVHVYIVGDKSRINFPTPTNEEVIRHVLQRVRELS